MSHKKSALDFITKIIEGNITEAYDKHTANNFIHHNAYTQAGKENLAKAMMQNELEYPGKLLQVCNVLEEENKVAIHSHIKTGERDTGIVVVHIFRFENEKIAELWDIGMMLPEQEINADGAF